MSTEVTTTTDPQDIIESEINHVESVCSDPAEAYKLLKLFEIFIEIDKSLQKRSNEDNQRNTNNTCQA
jgi:hypothetical protein